MQPDQGNIVAMRFLRPYAARGALAGLHAGFGEALGLPGGSGLGVASLATSGGMLTLAGATAAVWTVDWMINHADAVLHRAEFEAALATAIEAAWRADAAALATPVLARLNQAAQCLARSLP